MIFLVNINFLSAQKDISTDEFLSNSIELVLLSESSIYLGEYYPDTNEELYNARIDFRVDGTAETNFTWEFTNLSDESLMVKMNYYGSSDGLNWTELNKFGYSKLNSNGKYFLRIVLSRLEISHDAPEGVFDNIITVTVSY